MFVKTTNDQIDQYPYTIGNLRRDNPNTSFPKRPSNEILSEWGVEVVVRADDPIYDPDTQKVQTSDQPELIDGQWTLTKTVVALTADELADVLVRKKQAIKARRDEALNSGTTVNGVTVATDDLSQQRITSAALAATVDNTTTVKWKLPDDSFVTLDATQIIGIAQGVRAHVQACFDREAELLDALNAGIDYDIEAGWPS
jgi:hypothetical protein